jgi:phosphoglucosamine mutase
VILSDYGTTGDGLVAALQALSALEQSDKPASELCQVFTPVPQILENIRVRDRQTMEDGAVKDLILEKTAALEGRGRILVRASGTEPLIRVMAEGDDKDEISRTVKEIIGKISEADALKATG